MIAILNRYLGAMTDAIPAHGGTLISHMVFVAEPTVELLARRPDDVAFVDELEIRGRRGKIRLWALGAPPRADAPAAAAPAARHA